MSAGEATNAFHWRTYSLGNEDLTEDLCTNNENADQLRKLTEVESKGK